MREIAALMRASWLTETSYRMNMLFSLGSLAFMVLPLYFVATALQSTMVSRISSEADQYFAFALVGATIYTFISACTTALPSALASAIGKGTLEAFLATPTSVAALFAGMSAYSIGWALLRATIMIGAGSALGAHLSRSGLPAALLILLLLALAYTGFGLVGAALLLRFRTTGPVLNGVLTGSALLGGVYYPTHVIPSWLQEFSKALPLSYGLRAMRQVTLIGEPLRVVGHDLTMLALYVTVLIPVGLLCVAAALHYARRSGTLGHY